MKKNCIHLILWLPLLLPNVLWAKVTDTELRETVSKVAVGSTRPPASLITAHTALKKFYAQRDFKPAWPSPDRNPDLSALLTAISEAPQQGLNPGDYNLKALQQAIETKDSVAVELLATNAFLTYGAHIVGGRLNALTFEPDWTASKRERNLVEILQSALDKHSIAVHLRELEPDAPAYKSLKKALMAFSKIEANGGWESVPTGKSLKLGESGPRVVALRNRLRASGLLIEESSESPETFDIALESAVAKFQRRIGIEADGVAGNITLKHLNIPAAERVKQIRANLERWRWLPENLGPRHIRVNIADFRLEARMHGQIEREHIVIVGRTYRMTPVFSDNISYIVFNPWWETPPSLARQDKLPAFKSNPESVKKLGFEVLDSNGKPVNSENIRWSQYDASNFPYRLRQRPGPLNALGQVKIMFPNKHNVYLHDTPTRELFSKSERALSSGCIRVHDTVSLTEWILRDTPSWTSERIDNVIAGGKETRADLKNKIPVHILYFTAVTDPDGSLRFVNDVYGRDQKLVQALHSAKH